MKRMTKEELMVWAADHYSTAENSEGSPDESLMAGWVNVSSTTWVTTGSRWETGE